MKKRLDELLVERGLAESRTLAQRLIREGKVRVEGRPNPKPGNQYPDDIGIEVEQDNRFVSRGGWKLEGAFVSDSVPFFAKYARIVITPNEDEKVTTLEVLKYAKQLNAKVNREQGFKNYTENLLDFSYENYYINQNGVLTENDPENSSYSFVSTCEYVNISSYEEGLYFKDNPDSSWTQGMVFFFYDINKNFIDSVVVRDFAVNTFISSEGVYYYELDLKFIPENSVFVRLYTQNTFNFPGLYCR